MGSFCDTFASFLKSWMLVAFHCHYMDKRERDIFIKKKILLLWSIKEKKALEQHQGE